MDKKFTVGIIGAGPAGLTAAIYLARANLSTIILEHEAPGGKLIKTAEIDNWPGTRNVNGVDLAMKMFDHASALGVNYAYGDVSSIVPKDGYHEVVCSDGTVYHVEAVIIASGTKERLMNIPNEKEMTGRGVSYCAVCDGAFFKGKSVAVIGGGNAALEEAIYLTRFVEELTIVIRRDVFRAAQKLVDEILANPKIKVIYKHVPIEVEVTDNKVSGLLIENVEDKTRTTIAVSGIFPYIGADPVTGMVNDLGITDEQGFLLVDREMATAIPGIYGAGDVCAKNLRQVVTAANDGAIAAISISHYLGNK